MNKQMETIDEWEQWELSEVRRFVSWYKSHMIEAPDNYPNPLPEGEYDEQYRIYRELL